MHYEFYIDVYIVTNFFFDYLTLFLIREVRRKQTKTGRMAVMALLGVLSVAASMLLLKNAGIYKILVHLLINPLMFYFCFQQKSIREFLTDYAAGYLIMLLLGGSVEWLCRLLGQRNLFGWVMGGIAGVVTIFLLLFQDRKEEEKIYDIRVCHKGKEVSTKGFFDTGNLLMDPYSNLPVSLIEKNTLEMLTGEEPVLYRYIPFVSLGEEHGMVQAVILDSLYIKKEKRNCDTTGSFCHCGRKIFKRQYIPDNFKWAIMVKERSSRKCT